MLAEVQIQLRSRLGLIVNKTRDVGRETSIDRNTAIKLFLNLHVSSEITQRLKQKFSLQLLHNFASFIFRMQYQCRVIQKIQFRIPDPFGTRISMV